MKARCTNPKNKHYALYGARGISVCKEWLNSFQSFLSCMGFRPSAKHQIDRIDNNGNYTPENCRWASPKENCSNKRTNVFYTFKGETKTATQWAEELGINRGAIRKRINAGWPLEAVFTTPKIPRKFRTKPSHVYLRTN
jgi:hypothetical protein